MIVKARRTDINIIIDMMKKYSSYSPIFELRTTHNEQHVRNVVDAIIVGQGFVLLAFKDETPVGMFIAIRHGNTWNPDVKILTELAFWVEPEHRHSSVGYRLLKEYEKCAEEMLINKSITAYTVSRLESSEFDPAKRGFKPLDFTYFKQLEE
jgi:N-acetylglutamate synthase-like GNAT family acetyltransferase